jgi:hypothetical protein
MEDVDHKLKFLFNNTTSSVGTQFLQGAELVRLGLKKYRLHSERWAYPYLCFGSTDSRYYAEIWTNGMDWQNNYWIIEAENWECPKVYPLIVFENQSEEDKMPAHDLKELLRAILWRRRDMLWVKSGDDGAYHDTVWPFFKVLEQTDEKSVCTYEHASCPLVKFQANVELFLVGLKSNNL